MTASAGADSTRIPAWLARGVLLLAVAAAWLNALPAPFQFDDWWAVHGKASVASVSAWWNALPGIRPLLIAATDPSILEFREHSGHQR